MQVSLPLESRKAKPFTPLGGVLRGVENQVNHDAFIVELVENFKWKMPHECPMEGMRLENSAVFAEFVTSLPPRPT